MSKYSEAANELFPDSRGALPVTGGGNDVAQVPSRSKYAQAGDELFGEQRSAVSASIYNAQNINPDHQAEAIRLAQKRGLPTSTVRDNLDEVRRQDERESIDYDGLVQKNPALARWLAVPDNAAVARDDIGALSEIGRIVRPVADVARSLPAGALKGAGSILSGAGTLIDTGASVMDRTYRAAFGDAAADALIFEDAPWWLNPTEILRRPGEQTKAAGRIVGAPEERQNLGTDIGEGVGQLGTQIAAMLFTGGSVGTGMLFAQGADQQLQMAQEAGADRIETDTAVLAGGAVTAALERTGLDLILNRVPPAVKNRALRVLADASVAGGIEAVQEAAEGAMQNVVAAAIYNPNQPLFEGLEREAAAAGGSGFVARLLINAILPGRQAQRAQSQSGTFEETNAAADASVLRQRLPEKFQEAVEAQLKETGQDQILIPMEQWETLFQSEGIDPAAAYLDMAGDDSAYREAAATRSDLRIPYAAYLAKVDPAMRKKLMPHLRMSPEDMTAFEAEEFRKNAPDLIGAATKAAQGVGDTLQSDPAYDEIYSGILGQLQDRFPRDVAEKYATAEAARFIAFNRLNGTDPVEDYRANAYKVLSQAPEALSMVSAELDPLIDRLRDGEVPAEADAPGRALSDFLSRRGVDLNTVDNEAVKRMLSAPTAQDVADSAAGDQVMDQSKAGPGTAAFDAWFGDSKVVDAEGKPQVVYHGTRADFDTFKSTEGSDLGFHFGTVDQAEGRSGTRLMGASNTLTMPVYLSIKNPLRVNDPGYFGVQAPSNNAFALELRQLGVAAIPGMGNAELTRAIEAAGYDGLVYENKSEGEGGDSWVALRPEQIKSVYNRGTFDPNDPNILNQDMDVGPAQTPLQQRKDGGRRANIRFARGEDRAARDFVITLMEGADLSSFIHESGHYWLERLASSAKREGSPEPVKQMMQTLLDHWGLKDSSEIGVDHHEDFARMNEAYLMEGKAPSPRLREVFARFRSWLLAIYKRVQALDVNLTPEVRDVFDRLYASSEEIEQARAVAGMTAVFRTQAEAGMTDAEWAAYTRDIEASRRQAEEELTAEVMAPLLREQKSFWKEEREKVRKEVEAAANKRRDFVALSVLRNGKLPDGTPVPDAVKLSKKSLMDDFGMTPEKLKTLPKGIYSVEGGVSPDVASGVFGYANGRELVDALVSMPDRKKYIEDATNEAMRQKYPDIATDGSIRERATLAVHNDKAGELMVREAQILAKKAGAASTGKTAGLRRYQLTLQAAKAAAQQVVDATPLRLINPNKWKVAASRSATEAFKLAGAGKHAEALQAKERQLLNHALYRAATNAVEAAAKARDYHAKIANNKDRRQRIGMAGGWEYVVRDRDGNEEVFHSAKAAADAVEERGGFYFATNTYLDQIDKLLENYELRPISNRKLNRRESLREFVKGLEEEGIPHSIPDEVLREAQQTNYRELPFGFFMGLTDAVKSIEKIALHKNKLRLSGEERQLDELAEKISVSIRSKAPGNAPPIGTRKWTDKSSDFGKEALSVWLSPNYITREMDGAESGIVNEAIYRPIVQDEAKRNIRKREDTEKLAAIFAKHYTPAELRGMASIRGNNGIAIPELGVTWSKFDVLSLLANWGNNGNREAVLAGIYSDGRRITMPLVQRLLGTGSEPGILTAKDAAFMQDVWDFINRYKDEVAAVHQQRTGTRLEMVQGDPFSIITEDGKLIAMHGGYFPLKFDPQQGQKANQNDSDDFFKSLSQGAGSMPQTKRGHTIERVGSGGNPVRIDFKGVLFSHLNEVITNLEMGDSVNSVARILKNGRVRRAFIDKGRGEYLKALDMWLRDAAIGEMPARSAGGRFARWAKTNFTKALLTFKVGTAVMQLTGYAQSMAVIGPAAMYRGMRQFVSREFEGKRGIKEQIMSMSPYMRERWEGNQYNPAVADVMKASEGKRSYGPFVAGGYWMMGEMQKLVDAPTWLGAYDASIRKQGDPEKAVRDADDAIERAQTGGMMAQRSGFLRGTTALNEQQSEWVKAFTALQSYMMAKGNLAYEMGRQTNFRRPADVLKFTSRIVWLFTAETMMLGTLKALLGQGWDDEDDDDSVLDDAARWLAVESALGLMGVIPLGGMLGSELQGFRGSIPIQEVFETTSQAATQIGQGEFDAPFWKSLSNTIGALTGAPSGQVNVALDAYFRDQAGEDVSPIDYVMKTKNQ